MDVIGAVLAGGRSQRMGRDKAALLLRHAYSVHDTSERTGWTTGESRKLDEDWSSQLDAPELTWLERAILFLARRFAEPWVVGRTIELGDPAVPNLVESRWRFPALRSRNDLRPGAGPLAGLETALELAADGAALVIPLDLPRLQLPVLDLLLEARGIAPALAFRHASGRVEPSVMLVEPETLPDLRRYLDQGGRTAHRFLEIVNVRWLELPSDLEGGFLNINTPDDLARLTPRAKSTRQYPLSGSE